MPEVEVLVGQVVPAISAAVGAYGVGVLSRVQEAAAEGMVGLGRRILARLLGVAAERGRLEAAVVTASRRGRLGRPDAYCSPSTIHFACPASGSNPTFA